MVMRSSTVKSYYANQHAAAADVSTRVRDWVGPLAAKQAVVIGGAGFGGATVDSAVSPNGTLKVLTTKSISNLVLTNIEAADSTDNLKVADSIALCIAATGLGVSTLLPRVQRYTAGSEAQKVVYNPGTGAVNLSATWEETAVPGFCNGVHPGNGVVTIPLGTITPASYSAGTAPIYFRIPAGRAWVITSAKVRSITAIAPVSTATLDIVRSDAQALNTSAVNLKTLVSGTLTTIPLAVSAATRTISAEQYVDIVVTLGSYDGSGGDLAIELEYTLS